ARNHRGDRALSRGWKVRVRRSTRINADKTDHAEQASKSRRPNTPEKPSALICVDLRTLVSPRSSADHRFRGRAPDAEPAEDAERDADREHSQELHRGGALAQLD